MKPRPKDYDRIKSDKSKCVGCDLIVMTDDDLVFLCDEKRFRCEDANGSWVFKRKK